MEKDCWINQIADEKDGENSEEGDDTIESAFQIIGKSSTDEYLNCSSVNLKDFNHLDPDSIKKLETISTKLKGQEIQMQFPCVVSNVGTRRINVQSIAQPNVHAQFALHDADFIAFANYNTLQQIGFNDNRKRQEKNTIPFNETGEHIAFLTRA